MANEIAIVDHVIGSVGKAAKMESVIPKGAFDIAVIPGEQSLRVLTPEEIAAIGKTGNPAVIEKFADGFNKSYGMDKARALTRPEAWKQQMLQLLRGDKKRFAVASAAGLIAVGAGVALYELADKFELAGHQTVAEVLRKLADQIQSNIDEETGDRNPDTVFGVPKDKAEEFMALQEGQFHLIDGLYDIGMSVQDFNKLRDAIFGIERAFADNYVQMFGTRRRPQLG